MWGLRVYLTQYCFIYIYVYIYIYVLALGHCSLFRDHKPSAWRIPNTHFTDMSMAYVWPRVATWKEYPIIPLTLDSGSINGWDTFLGDSRNPKAGRMKSLWNPTINLFFGGVDLPFFGLNPPKIWVIWVWLVVEFFKQIYFFCFRKKGERFRGRFDQLFRV